MRCSPAIPGSAGSRPRDRAHARLLAATTLRRLGQIDAVLDRFLRQAPKSLRVRNLLRLGAAQLLFLHTPAHAAVAETVALASGREAFARGLANAVLRRVAQRGRGAGGGAGRSAPEHPRLALAAPGARAYGESTTRADRRGASGRAAARPHGQG